MNMEMTFLQDTECYNNQIIKNWGHFGCSAYGGIQKDTMCSFRKGVLKNIENSKPESPGSPLFCKSHSGHHGLIGMEFNILMVKNDKIKMTVFLNIQAQRKWIDSVLDGMGVLRASKHLQGISEQSVKSNSALVRI